MNNQPENMKGMRTKIKAQQDHIRKLEKIIADSRIAPVPPAGDVEVLLDSVIDEMSRRFDLSKRDDDHMVCDDTQIGVEFAIKALRPALARLTAERDAAIKAATLGAENLNKALETCDALREELDKYRRGFWGRMAARTQIALRKSESELTKARELIDRALTDVGKSMSTGVREDLEDFLAHQSAPAAKGGSDAD